MRGSISNNRPSTNSGEAQSPFRCRLHASLLYATRARFARRRSGARMPSPGQGEGPLRVSSGESMPHDLGGTGKIGSVQLVVVKGGNPRRATVWATDEDGTVRSVQIMPAPDLPYLVIESSFGRKHGKWATR